MSPIMCSFIEKYKYQRGNVFDSNVHSQILRIQPEAFLTPVVLPCVRGFLDPAQTILCAGHPETWHEHTAMYGRYTNIIQWDQMMVGGKQFSYMEIRFLNLLRMLGKSNKFSPKWWFDGAPPWYKVKSHLKQIKGDWNTKHGPKSVVPFKHQISFRVRENTHPSHNKLDCLFNWFSKFVTYAPKQMRWIKWQIAKRNHLKQK